MKTVRTARGDSETVRTSRLMVTTTTTLNGTLSTECFSQRFSSSHCLTVSLRISHCLCRSGQRPEQRVETAVEIGFEIPRGFLARCCPVDATQRVAELSEVK